MERWDERTKLFFFRIEVIELDAGFKRAIFLSWFTIIYNLIEGVVSIAFGVNDDSISLAGFGVDSLIEVASAFLILWRFRSAIGAVSAIAISRERKATFGIGVLFLLLSCVTTVASVLQLRRALHPQTTVSGVVISLLSLSFMLWLWKSKRRLARQLNSTAMSADARCSLVCIQLSSVLFIGSLLFVFYPTLWWADSVAAIVIALLIGKEGVEAIRAARQSDFLGGCGCNYS